MTPEITPARRGGETSFELERFEWAAPDRLEIAGRWFGVRGLRFMRPALDLNGDGERRRLLALLEHKPWAAQDGEDWIAAFPWEGDHAAFTDAELAVTPTIAVELAVPGAPKGKPSAQKKSGAQKKPGVRKAPKRARNGAQRVRAEAPRSRALAEAKQLREERDAAMAARDAAQRERDEAVATRDMALRERADAVAARDTAIRERDALADAHRAALRERDEARALAHDRDGAVAARGAVIDQLETLTAERDAAMADRAAAREAVDAAIRDRQAACAERDARTRQRDAALRKRDEVERERDELKARLDERALQPPVPRARSARPARGRSDTPRWTERGLVVAGLATLILGLVAAISPWL